MDRLALHRTDTWAHGAKPAQKQYAAIARPSPSSRRSLCAPTRTTTPTKAVFEDDENVTVIEMTTDDAWFRDTGATYVIDGKGDKRACDWHFNAYGGFHRRPVPPGGRPTTRSPARWPSCRTAAAIVPTT